MKNFITSLVAAGLALCVAAGNCLADNYYCLTINGSHYYDGQTVYINCDQTNVDVRTDRTPVDNSSLPGAKFWDASSGYAINSVYGAQSGSGSEAFFHITLSTNGSDGYVHLQLWEGNTNITVNISRKPPISFVTTPNLCSSGQSGAISAAVNFTGQPAMNIQWQTTGGISVNGSSSYTTYGSTNSQVSAQHNSFGSISAYGVIPGCNNLQTNTITRYIGTPSGSDITFAATGGGDNGSSFCVGNTRNYQSSILLPASQYSYNWSIPTGSSNVSYFYSYDVNATLTAGSQGGFVLQMNVTNTACNTTGGTSRTFFISNCNGGYYSVTPNPTSNLVTASFDQDTDEHYLPNTLQVVNDGNTVVKEVKIKGQYSEHALKNGLKVDIDVHALPRGTYYLRGIYGSSKSEAVRIVLQ
ncbi:hypothetical protein GCM10028819_09290 [Spirosoma humi]